MRSRSKGSSPRNMAAISVSISALVTPPPSVSPRPRSPSSVSIWMTSRVQSALAPPDQRIGATKGMLTISTLIFAIFIAGSYGKNGSAIVSGVPVLHLGLFLRLHPPTPTRPRKAGLSHVGNELKEEVIVPSCSFEFLAHGYAVGMGSNDIESEATQDGQVFRPVVFSGATGILVEDDVEDPVEAIFDAPMGTDDLQQALRRHVGGEEEVADHGFVCGLALNSSVCGDAGEGDDAGELVGAAMLVSRMTTAERFSFRSWVAGSRVCAVLRGPPERANRLTTASNSLLWLALSARTKLPPRASTAAAKGRLQCWASAVTVQPSSESIASTSKAPLASLRPGALREAKTIRAAPAKTLTRCIGVAALPRS